MNVGGGRRIASCRGPGASEKGRVAPAHNDKDDNMGMLLTFVLSAVIGGLLSAAIIWLGEFARRKLPRKHRIVLALVIGGIVVGVFVIPLVAPFDIIGYLRIGWLYLYLVGMIGGLFTIGVVVAGMVVCGVTAHYVKSRMLKYGLILVILVMEIPLAVIGMMNIPETLTGIFNLGRFEDYWLVVSHRLGGYSSSAPVFSTIGMISGGLIGLVSSIALCSLLLPNDSKWRTGV